MSIVGSPNSMPHCDGVLRLGEQLGHVQQGLRRDAPAVGADASGIDFLVDEDDLHPEIRGEEGGGVAARPRPQHDEWICVGHGSW